MSNIYSRMSGFGYYVPPRKVTNHELAAHSNTSDEWIVSRTGISARHILDNGMTGTDMAVRAAESALANAGKKAGDLTHVVYATCTPDSACPSAACIVTHKLGLRGIMALDINAACSGFINGIEVADSLACRHPDACVLLVASESLSHKCNWEDRSTAVLFGDGAGAVLISGRNAPGPELFSANIVDCLLGADGSKGDLLLITGGYAATPYKLGDTVGPDYFIRMTGNLVFKHAVRSMNACCKELLERNRLTSQDIDLFVPHQANMRIIEAVGERLGIPLEKVFLNVQNYGNTSAASIPLALGEAIEQQRIRQGMRVLLTTFGGGLTWGAGILQF